MKRASRAKNLRRRWVARRVALGVEQLELRLPLAGEVLPQMLRDINVQLPNSNPTEVVRAGDKLFISADDGIHGHELFVMNPSGQPTLVRDIYPGTIGAAPTHLVDVGGLLFFTADDGVHGRELWKSDGTAEGTMMVLDIFAGSDAFGNFSSNPSDLIEVSTASQSWLFFTAEDAAHGRELWKADASSASLVVDIYPGSDTLAVPHSSEPRNLTFVPERLATDGQLLPPSLFFSAETEAQGRELWQTTVSEGQTNTGLLKNIAEEAGSVEPTSSDPAGFIYFNGLTYFRARDQVLGDAGEVESSGFELWRTDGTSEGTVIVADLFPGSFENQQGETVFNSSSPDNLVVHNGLLYFSANDALKGRELWKTDGSTMPQIVRDIRIGPIGSSPSNLTSSTEWLYFIADGGQGRELWRTDGTVSETQLTKDIRPGQGTPFLFAHNMAALDHQLIFAADDGTLGPEIWISDGSLDGTQLLLEAQLGRNSAVVPDFITNVDGLVYFELAGMLWRTDGTAHGTQRIDLNTPATLASQSHAVTLPSDTSFVFVDGLYYFAADDGIHGIELWKSDGSRAGTQLVKDIDPGTTSFPSSSIRTPFSSQPRELTTLGNRLFFIADRWQGDQFLDSQLMASDGSPAGTVSLGSVAAESLFVFNERLFFAGRTDQLGSELWTSDGTVDGTTALLDLFPGANGSFPSQFVSTGTKMFFVANDGRGDSLWVSDGTVDGTFALPTSIGTGGAPTFLNVVGELVYFRAHDELHGSELWVSNGTPEGTRLVRDINIEDGGAAGSRPIPLGAIDNHLVFFANAGAAGQQLWRTDGTDEGTTIIADIRPGTIDEFELEEGSRDTNGHVIVFGGRIYFAADDGVHGNELWASDGSSTGTVLVKDLFQGVHGSVPSQFTVHGDRLFFAATDGRAANNDEEEDVSLGRELWSTDGTMSGTAVVAELNSVDGLGSQPHSITSVGEAVMFVASDGVHGHEIWSTELRLKADDELFEVLARDIAYRDSLVDDQPIVPSDTLVLRDAGYPMPYVFTIDLVIHDPETGFDAYGLVADNSDPILVLRGSADLPDFFSDLMPEGIGVNQFEANRSQLFQWLDAKTTPNHPVSITGHSLGGALTQLVASAYTAANRKLGQVVTFNAPAINELPAESFVVGNVERVMHYITDGDPVSLAGYKFIEGAWRRSYFDDLNIAHNHQLPVLVDYTIADDAATPGLDRRFRAADIAFEEYSDTSVLNDPLFHHTDSDYFFWLAAAQALTSSDDDLRQFADIPPQLFFRVTTESQRQRVGEAIERFQAEVDAIIGTLTCTSPDSVVRVPDISLNLLSLLRIEASNLSATCVAGETNQLRFQGNVVLPQINNATADFSGENYIGVRDDGFDLVGRLSIEELSLLPGSWGLRDVFVELDTVAEEILAGGTLIIPTGIALQAELGFLQGEFDSVSLAVPGGNEPGINRPLGTTSIFLQRITGSVSNVSAAAEDPITFQGNIQATGGPAISISLPDWAGGNFGGSLIQFDVNGLLDKDHLLTTGNLSIINGLATAVGEVELNWSNPTLRTSGAFDVLDGLITANGSFSANSDLDLNLFADATFGVPDAVPLIGGIDAVDGRFTLDFTNDANFANDYVAAWTTFNIPFIGDHSLGFRVFLDGDFGLIGAAEIDQIIAGQGDGEGEGEGDQQSAIFDISGGTPWFIVSAEWDPALPDPHLILTTPGGVVLTEADIIAHESIAIIENFSSAGRRAVIVRAPESGEWRISLDADAGSPTFHAFTPSIEPSLEIISVEGGANQSPVKITVDAHDIDSQAVISLFYDTDGSGFDGIPIIRNLNENDGTLSHIWNVYDLPLAEYFVYATIDDGINPTVYRYASSPIDTSSIQHPWMSQSSILIAREGDAEPRVQIVDVGGAGRAEFLAFDAEYRGGVRVAAGDLNADGIPDIVTAPSNGSSVPIKVFNGFDGQLLRSFFPFEADSMNNVRVTSGDFDGNGIDDLAVVGVSEGLPHVKIFGGLNLRFLTGFDLDALNGAQSVALAAGDLENDGTDELVVGSGTGVEPRVFVYDVGTEAPIVSLNPLGASFSGGVELAVGDITSDGIDDIVVGSSASETTSPAQVIVFDGASLDLAHILLPFGESYFGGVQVAIADIDSDNLGKLIVGSSSGAQVRIYRGDWQEPAIESFGLSSDASGVTLGAPKARRIETFQLPLEEPEYLVRVLDGVIRIEQSSDGTIVFQCAQVDLDLLRVLGDPSKSLRLTIQPEDLLVPLYVEGGQLEDVLHLLGQPTSPMVFSGKAGLDSVIIAAHGFQIRQDSWDAMSFDDVEILDLSTGSQALLEFPEESLIAMSGGVPQRLVFGETDDLRFDGEWKVVVPQLEPGGFLHRALYGNVEFELVHPLAYFNTVSPFDVNFDGNVTPIDALIVINRLNREGVIAKLVAPVTEDELLKFRYLDTNQDNALTPIDALRVLNYLNRLQQP